MTLASPPTRFTPDDLLRLEQGDALYELVDGRLVEKEMSSLAHETSIIISSRLYNFCEPSQLGKLYSEQTYQCFAHDPDLIRRPDISLVVAGRVSQVPKEGHVPIAPDLVVEVLSPNDRVYEFERKLMDYRRAKVKLVWEVNPEFRFIRVHHLDREPRRFEETDTITGDPVLPGFSILVSELLPKVS